MSAAIEMMPDIWGELRSLLNSNKTDAILPNILWHILSQDKDFALAIVLPYCKSQSPDLDWDFVDWCIAGVDALERLISECVYPYNYNDKNIKHFVCALCWLAVNSAEVEKCSCVVKISDIHYLGCCLGTDDNVSNDYFQHNITSDEDAKVSIWREFGKKNIEMHIAMPGCEWSGIAT